MCPSERADGVPDPHADRRDRGLDDPRARHERRVERPPPEDQAEDQAPEAGPAEEAELGGRRRCGVGPSEVIDVLAGIRFGVDDGGHCWRRARAISKQASVPAVPTLRLATRPRMGMETSSSQRSRTSRRQARALGAQHERDRRVVHGQVPEGLLGPLVEAHHPDAGVLHGLDGRGQAAHRGHRQVLDGAGRGLGDRGRDVHGPVLGQDHAGHAGALGGAQQRAEVAGVGDAVAAQQERRRLRPLRRTIRSSSVSLGERLGEGDDALRGVGAGGGVELGPARPP